ncbi:PREDICTED: transmembrane protein 147 isoform X2 [Nanorana parkeri]|uniref:transmembrane protein 147 isoform X2 n=1 Tax=Nanorana parkeri TaxID=125878 RepID=UPI000854FBB4|nr:PREDICTED: transmembrane protein 147 isoform X2 [Nanorana parkeri]
MTLFHFGNCFALAYFPYFITYKCSGLSEYNAFWRCVQAGATYLCVQLCKMLFLATFFPTWEGAVGAYDFIGVHYMAIAALVWMWTRYDLPTHFRLPVTVLLGLSMYKAFLMDCFVHIFLLGSWTALLLKAVVTGLLSLSCLTLFVSLVHSN